MRHFPRYFTISRHYWLNIQPTPQNHNLAIKLRLDPNVVWTIIPRLFDIQLCLLWQGAHFSYHNRVSEFWMLKSLEPLQISGAAWFCSDLHSKSCSLPVFIQISGSQDRNGRIFFFLFCISHSLLVVWFSQTCKLDDLGIDHEQYNVLVFCQDKKENTPTFPSPIFQPL